MVCHSHAAERSTAQVVPQGAAHCLNGNSSTVPHSHWPTAPPFQDHTAPPTSQIMQLRWQQLQQQQRCLPGEIQPSVKRSAAQPTAAAHGCFTSCLSSSWQLCRAGPAHQGTAAQAFCCCTERHATTRRQRGDRHTAKEALMSCGSCPTISENDRSGCCVSSKRPEWSRRCH
jgi:hypothetical protein